MSSKFAVWLRVKPPPATLAESRAIFKHIQARGRVTAFTKTPRHEHDDDSKTASYYTVFAHEPPSLRVKLQFDVPVYHDLPSLRDEDPFNIRGLQDRKPWPSPVNFTCTFERLNQNEVHAVEKQLSTDNPFHGSFKVKRAEDDWLQEVMSETGASPGIVKGLGQMEEYTTSGLEGDRDQLDKNKNFENANSVGTVQLSGSNKKRQARKRKLRMDSLIERADSV